MENNDYKNIITVKFAQAQQPKFEENKGAGYINFGVNNDYPKYLLDLYKESPKHGAIVKGKSIYIYGKGFDGITDSANTKGESWNKVFKKCVKDDEIFGGYYLQIVYNLLGKIKEVFHVPYHKVRTNKTECKFWVKNDWADLKEKARVYNAFDNKYVKGEPSQIYFVKQYDACTEVYPYPSYFQGLNYIDADIQVGRHILGNAKDGFVATTLIQLNSGNPQEEQKEAVERGIKKKFTGSEGDRVVIMFNSSKDNSAEIVPLSSTMLTKEDFTAVNKLIQGEIFVCHQATSPILFGIKSEGELGGKSEIKEAYEIFNNTYVNERQQAHEETFNGLLIMKGVQADYKITPVEPLGFSLEDSMLLQVMPREYFLDKLGVEEKYYPLPPVTGTAATTPPPTTDASGNVVMANDNLKNLTGRQFQGVMRIVNKYMAGKLTKDQAALMLKQGFAFTDSDVDTFLGIDSDPSAFSDEEIDFALIEQFGQVGESREAFEVVSKKPARESEYFADVQQLSQLESNILNLIKKDKRITPEVLATTLKVDLEVVNKSLAGMEKAGVISAKETKIGEDNIIERSATDASTKGPKPTTTEILLRYSYEGPRDERNRPFCAKLMELDRLYSRADIETISERLGYSVWDRRGGWFTQPDGTHRPFCRHQWFAVTVIRKTN